MGNADELHLLTCSKTAIDTHTLDATVSNEKRFRLLEINLESRLDFEFHVDALIKKASKKCLALPRVSNYMDSNKSCVLMNAFIKFQFSYYPLLWIFHRRLWTTKLIDSIKSFRIVYRTKTSFYFEDLLIKDETVDIHPRNLLATEKYISERSLLLGSPIRSPMRSNSNKKINCSIYFGTEIISSLAPKIWELIHNAIENAMLLEFLKKEIRCWAIDKCPHRLCKVFSSRLVSM